MCVVGYAGDQPVEQRAACPRLLLTRVGRRALLGHGLEVEQVGGRLRHQTDELSTAGAGLGRGIDAGHAHHAGAPRARALQGPQQGRLARAVAAHQRRDAALAQLERHVAEGDGPAHQHGQGRRRPAPVADRVGGRCRRGAHLDVASEPAGVAHGHRQRRPAEPPTELDDRGYDGRGGEQVGRRTAARAAVAGQEHHPVGERDDPLEPVLGHQHRHPEVVHEPGERGQHLLGRSGIEGGRRLVEHQQSRVHRQHRPDRDPLLLAPRQGAEVAAAQPGDAEQVEGLLHPASHRAGGQAELLHAVGELLLHAVGDEARGRVLSDVPDEMGAFTRRLVDHGASVDQHVAGQRAAGEPRDEPGHHAEQRGLADAGASRDQHQLALVEGQVDVAEHGTLVVPEADGAQLDHAAPPARTRRAQGTEDRCRDRDQRERAEGRSDGEGGVGDGELVPRDPPAGRADQDPGGGDDQLRPAPAVGPVARARHPAPGQPDRHHRHQHADHEHRAPEPGRRRRVEAAVHPDADRAEPEQHQPAGGTPLARRRTGGAAVAPRVHPGGQRQRALEGVLEHRDQQPPQAAHPTGLATPQQLCRPHPPDAVGELRKDGHRDHQGAPDLVERRRHGAEQPLGVRQGVGRADADHDGRQPQPVVEPGQERVLGDRTEQTQSQGPVRQRDRRQVQQHLATVTAADQDPEQHPDHHDRDPEPQVDAEGVGPRLGAAARRHGQAGHPDQEQEEIGVGREATPRSPGRAPTATTRPGGGRGAGGRCRAWRAGRASRAAAALPADQRDRAPGDEHEHHGGRRDPAGQAARAGAPVSAVSRGDCGERSVRLGPRAPARVLIGLGALRGLHPRGALRSGRPTTRPATPASRWGSTSVPGWRGTRGAWAGWSGGWSGGWSAVMSARRRCGPSPRPLAAPGRCPSARTARRSPLRGRAATRRPTRRTSRCPTSRRTTTATSRHWRAGCGRTGWPEHRRPRRRTARRRRRSACARRRRRGRRPCPPPAGSHAVDRPFPSWWKSTTTVTPEEVLQVAARAGDAGTTTPAAATAKVTAARRRACRSTGTQQPCRNSSAGAAWLVARRHWSSLDAVMPCASRA